MTMFFSLSELELEEKDQNCKLFMDGYVHFVHTMLTFNKIALVLLKNFIICKTITQNHSVRPQK